MFTEELLTQYLADYARHDTDTLRERWYTPDVEFETITAGLTQGLDAVLATFGTTMHVNQLETYSLPFIVVSADGERGAALLEGHRYFTGDRPDQGAVAGDRLTFAIIALYRFTGERISYIATGRLRFTLNPDEWDPPAELRDRLPQ